ncbi:MAG: hypothetical protein ACM33T_04745 [Solirubrobacterales bacterium]
MDRQHYDRLLSLAERSDLSPEERLKFIEEAEALADAPGGVHAALPALIRAAARLGADEDEAEAARYVREAIRMLRQME